MNNPHVNSTTFDQAKDREIALHARQVYHLENLPAGTVFTALEGRLWVTCQDDRRDYLLQPGGSLSITSGGVVLVEGLPAGRLRITLPAGAAPAGGQIAKTR